MAKTKDFEVGTIVTTRKLSNAFWRHCVSDLQALGFITRHYEDDAERGAMKKYEIVKGFAYEGGLVSVDAVRRAVTEKLYTHDLDETVENAVGLVTQLGKEYVIVRDFPGFVSNRVMMLAVNECAFVLQDGVAEAADVDKVFRLAFGHSMGPLATADLIGLDTVLNSINVLFDEYKDSKYRPCPLLQKMVDAGYLGRKSGRGFFKYGG